MKLPTIPAGEKRITVATFFTILRIIIIPFFIYSIVKLYWGRALFLFLLAIITDFLDGFLARLLHQKTILGACLDAIADKLLIILSYVTLFFMSLSYFPGFFVICVIGKEIIQIVGSYIIYIYKGKFEVRPTFFGKVTAVVHMIFIAWILMIQWVQFSCGEFFCNKIFIFVLLCMFLSFVQYIVLGYTMIYKRK